MQNINVRGDYSHATLARVRAARTEQHVRFAAPERPSCTSTWKSIFFVFFASSTFSSSTDRKVRRAYPLFFLTSPCVRDALAGRYRRHRGVAARRLLACA